jgi:hypothetical protein
MRIRFIFGVQQHVKIFQRALRNRNFVQNSVRHPWGVIHRTNRQLSVVGPRMWVDEARKQLGAHFQPVPLAH